MFVWPLSLFGVENNGCHSAGHESYRPWPAVGNQGAVAACMRVAPPFNAVRYGSRPPPDERSTHHPVANDRPRVRRTMDTTARARCTLEEGELEISRKNAPLLSRRNFLKTVLHKVRDG